MKTYNQIAEFGQKLMSLGEIENVLELIAGEAKKLVNTERCSIFIVDKEDGILWTKLSDGIGRIVISLDSGIVGDTYQKQSAQIVNDPYGDARFLQVIDKKSGYTTKNIITVPIFDSKREIIGIIELLNKSRTDFTNEDLETLTFFANYISGSLELVLMSKK
ncbi:MAG: GAF domain-containing protein [Sulfurimonas sp.]|jgi:GAF domain-containing protein|nr:GAF domain-containing protein [Sulfurimonas sp.]MBU1217688.1 GAF domain-containing protein [bacterium]MBU1434284.1 GAF domain-containing protein [bacterium]MBU1503675.1 GAF domain-containing protein [bacterium]MBU3939493.1 GAF domain-containing protein [bacterium]